LCYLINTLLCRMYRREYQNFIRIINVEEQQRQKLLGLLARNRDTSFGRRYAFGTITGVADYQDRVPLTTYENYIGDISKIGKGEQGVLTRERVILLEPTSGSTAATKLIPYTRSLKDEFQKGLKPWLYDLYTQKAGIRWGKSYWSITPAASQRQFSPGGIPIGFEEDSAYFGALERKLMDYLFAVPGHVSQTTDMDTFILETAVHLLLCRNLTLISVWNPTFLFLLLEFMTREADQVLDRVRQKNSRRVREVEEILKTRDYRNLWPHLQVISCWLDGYAAVHEKQLREWFPQVTIQPKGLLATEGFISFPFVGEEGARLSLGSHFFEFRNPDDEQIFLAHQLEPGRIYEVILTTAGGLYRYRLKDLVEVTGHSGVFPLLKFRGKADRVSDLFGEKLHEQLIEDTLKKLECELTLKPLFAMAAPEVDHYVLYLQLDPKTDQVNQAEGFIGVYSQLAKAFDTGLRTNYHYDYCRKLGQLKPLRVFRLTGNSHQEYLEECVKRGQRLGDVKPTALHLQGGWDLVFKGEYQ
jgi:hypothetical protein